MFGRLTWIVAYRYAHSVWTQPMITNISISQAFSVSHYKYYIKAYIKKHTFISNKTCWCRFLPCFFGVKHREETEKAMCQADRSTVGEFFVSVEANPSGVCGTPKMGEKRQRRRFEISVSASFRWRFVVRWRRHEDFFGAESWWLTVARPGEERSLCCGFAGHFEKVPQFLKIKWRDCSWTSKQSSNWGLSECGIRTFARTFKNKVVLTCVEAAPLSGQDWPRLYKQLQLPSLSQAHSCQLQGEQAAKRFKGR